MYIVLDTEYNRKNNNSAYMVVTTDEDVVEPISTELLGKIGEALNVHGVTGQGVKPNSIAEAIMLQLSGLHICGLDVQVYAAALGNDCTVFPKSDGALLNTSLDEVKEAIAYLSKRYGFAWKPTDLYRAVMGKLSSDFKLPWGVSFIQTESGRQENANNSRVLLSGTILSFIDSPMVIGMRNAKAHFPVDYTNGVLPYKRVPDTDDFVLATYHIPTSLANITELQSKLLLSGGDRYVATNGSLTEISSYCYADIGITEYKGNAALKHIEKNGFYHCAWLYSLDLRDSTELGNLPAEAFALCNSLQYILLENNNAMTELDYTENGFNSVFMDAGKPYVDYDFVAIRLDHSKKLERVNLKASTMLLSLRDCAALTTIECGLKWSPMIEMLDCTDCCSLNNIVMGGDRVRIYNANFSHCTALTDLYSFMRKCASNLISLDVSYCTQLKQFGSKHYFLEAVNLETFVGCSTAVEAVQDYCFYAAHSLTVVDLHDCKNLKHIGAYAFDRCEKLRHIDLSGCTSLVSVDLHAFPCALWSLFTISVADCSNKAIEQIDNALQEYATSNYHWVYDENKRLFRREQGEGAGMLKELARLFCED